MGKGRSIGKEKEWKIENKKIKIEKSMLQLRGHKVYSKASSFFSDYPWVPPQCIPSGFTTPRDRSLE
ncbi:unnamed protein product [Sphenostylis stenocarpa]|uniref:Uncharacterized protein n=1 Tax=Sphenostylis stenocarpa TaxID=92480 RepID=A0AA86RTZ6_9FABA|nr:unnamed protein product [Sphenostylis stenocarpa]